ncbi:MAG TPA: LysR family transcriptional regulator [Candidatus Hydrogenedentes bacterium]|nr:LysR family transcriptional regulator [Candidatus Hydrogenedentota bacterium]HOS02454.1 LysR family transcriptional regulator [Candidatus Hydrogenedentota bacterium]
MRYESIRHFCAVLEEGSFRKAAQRLRCSQPAVSQQVKLLERELGHVLLERRTCQPTPAGQLLYARARHISAELDGLVRELHDFDESLSGELRVGTSDTTAMYVLPPVVRAFSRAMPGVHLALAHRSSEAIAEQVHQGELDLGIVTLPVSQTDLVQQELLRQRLVLVTPQKHPLAKRSKVGLRLLEGEPLLLLQPQTRTGALLRECFRQSAFEPRVALDSGSFEVIKRYVAEGVGLAFLPEMAVTPSDKRLATVVVAGLPTLHIAAVTRHSAYRTKAAGLFLELVRNECSASPV